MAIEDFKNLIEIQSLESQLKSHLDEIEEQNKRVQHIESQRNIVSIAKEQLETELNEKSTKSSNLEKKLYELESKFEKTNEHIPLARNEQETNALQNELDTLGPLIESLQDEVLILMEEIEVLTESLKEKVEFIQGSGKSLEKISIEADRVKQKENESIKSLDERIQSLLDQTSENYKNSYLLSCKKHRFNNPLSFVQNNACHVCRFTLNQVQAREIEIGDITESCSGCGRLFTPLSAKNI